MSLTQTADVANVSPQQAGFEDVYIYIYIFTTFHSWEWKWAGDPDPVKCKFADPVRECAFASGLLWWRCECFMAELAVFCMSRSLWSVWMMRKISHSSSVYLEDGLPVSCSGDRITCTYFSHVNMPRKGVPATWSLEDVPTITMDHGEKSSDPQVLGSGSIQVKTHLRRTNRFKPKNHGSVWFRWYVPLSIYWGWFVHLFQPLGFFWGQYQLHHPRMDVLSPGKVRVGIPKFQAKRPKHCQQLGDLGVSLYYVIGWGWWSLTLRNLKKQILHILGFDWKRCWRA